MARTDPQINVRQSQDRYAILDAAAFVENKGTPSKLVQEIVDEAIDRYAELPAVKKALEARADQTSANAGKLARLPQDRAQKANTARPESS
jgi:uncharacterized protein (DUF1778 family)